MNAINSYSFSPDIIFPVRYAINAGSLLVLSFFFFKFCWGGRGFKLSFLIFLASFKFLILH